MSQLPFETALLHLKEGGKVTREAWGNLPTYIYYNPPFFMTKDGGTFQLYTNDLFSNDWVLVFPDEDVDNEKS